MLLEKVGDELFKHDTVLKQEAVNGLQVKPDGTYIDCTVGGGGHAEMILTKLNNEGKLIAFDQDSQALAAAQKRLQAFEKQTVFIHANFKYLKQEVEARGIDPIDGILFDLGVSSPQLDQKERGFSYRYDAKLDMRMDRTQSLTATNIVNEWSYGDLVRIFFHYGEEKFSKQIARKIVHEREKQPIETTFQLVELIKEAIPAPARRTGGHPARRIFQALRIAVNDELNVLNKALHQAADVISIGGRIAVITFHSLEDRLCKQAFRKWSTDKEVPRNLPIIPEGFTAPFKLITRKPIVAKEEELTNNRRARSAKLRIVEKVSAWDKEFTYKEGWKRS